MIKVGIGGWKFEQWRGSFYPKGLPQAQELFFASRALTSIEINGTFYRTQSAKSFRRWATEVPDDFIFSIKGPMSVVGQDALSKTGPALARFFASGVLEMRGKLGPFLWQLGARRKFDVDDIAAFFELLPKALDGTKLRHAVEVRHASFVTPAFVDLAREHAVAIALVDSEKHPMLADVTSDFMYLRLQRTSAAITTGYKPSDIGLWARRAEVWAAGGAPADLPPIGNKPTKKKRDVFLYMISGAKIRAPAAAIALIARLSQRTRRHR